MSTFSPWGWIILMWVVIAAVILLWNHGAHRDDADDDSH
jgi:hypothetical protein